MNLFQTSLNEKIQLEHHALVWVKSGTGILEVDCKTYTRYRDRLIFLAPGQIMHFLAKDFQLAIFQFPNSLVSKSKEYRVLFNHLLSLGYVRFTEERPTLLCALEQEDLRKLLDISTDQWHWQNPFKSSREEYDHLFDIKETIDAHLRERLTVEDLIRYHSGHPDFSKRLVKERLGLSIKRWIQRKKIEEAKKEIAFSKKPLKGVAYDLGFKDPAYFSRFFSENTRYTPSEFRLTYQNEGTDIFFQDLINLIQEYHRTQHTTQFYADRLYLSVKALSRKVKKRLNTTVGQLIRTEIIQDAKQLLPELSVRETAFELGFSEAHHFSTFFKKYVGVTPSQYKGKKYKS